MPLRTALALSLPLVSLAFLAPTLAAKDRVPTVEIQKCIKDLGDFDFEVREKASARLAEIGVPAVPALQDATGSSDPEVCQRAWRLIDQWAGEGKVPALLVQLSSRSEPIRANAAYNLGRLGADAKDAVPALVAASKDRSEMVRCSAEEALKAICAGPALTMTITQLDETVAVGDTTIIRIEVHNGGGAAATNVRINGIVPEQFEVVRIAGPNFRQDAGRFVSVPQTLDPGTRLRWEVQVKAVKTGEVKLPVEMMADQRDKAEQMVHQTKVSEAPVPEKKP